MKIKSVPQAQVWFAYATMYENYRHPKTAQRTREMEIMCFHFFHSWNLLFTADLALRFACQDSCQSLKSALSPRSIVTTLP